MSTGKEIIPNTQCILEFTTLSYWEMLVISFKCYCVLLLLMSEMQRAFPFVFQVSQQAAKCIPAMVCPELTEQIRREIAASLHQRKGDFACYFLTDLVTFTLPAGNFPTSVGEEIST